MTNLGPALSRFGVQYLVHTCHIPSVQIPLGTAQHLHMWTQMSWGVNFWPMRHGSQWVGKYFPLLFLRYVSWDSSKSLMGLNISCHMVMAHLAMYFFLSFLKNPHLKICLDMFIDFREREGGREREREKERDVRDKHQSVASPKCPDQGSNLQPRYVLWPGIIPAIFWCTGQCSNQVSHLARAAMCLFCVSLLLWWPCGG